MVYFLWTYPFASSLDVSGPIEDVDGTTATENVTLAPVNHENSTYKQSTSEARCTHGPNIQRPKLSMTKYKWSLGYHTPGKRLQRRESGLNSSRPSAID